MVGSAARHLRSTPCDLPTFMLAAQFHSCPFPAYHATAAVAVHYSFPFNSCLVHILQYMTLFRPHYMPKPSQPCSPCLLADTDNLCKASEVLVGAVFKQGDASDPREHSHFSGFQQLFLCPFECQSLSPVQHHWVNDTFVHLDLELGYRSFITYHPTHFSPLGPSILYCGLLLLLKLQLIPGSKIFPLALYIHRYIHKWYSYSGKTTTFLWSTKTYKPLFFYFARLSVVNCCFLILLTP